jgi:uncharacterized membrane protein
VAAAGIIHILCIFAIPRLAEEDAWARLAANLKPNTLAIADGLTVARLPFTPPDIVTAYCLYDVSKNNLIVKTPLAEPAWSLSVSTRGGENFYLVTGADAKKPEVRLLILRRDRLPEEASTEKTETGDEQNIIVAPSDTGIVTVSIPLRGESYRGIALAELRKAKCEPQKTVEPVVAAVEDPSVEPSEPPEQQRGQRHRKRR